MVLLASSCAWFLFLLTLKELELHACIQWIPFHANKIACAADHGPMMKYFCVGNLGNDKLPMHLSSLPSVQWEKKQQLDSSFWILLRGAEETHCMHDNSYVCAQSVLIRAHRQVVEKNYKTAHRTLLLSHTCCSRLLLQLLVSIRCPRPCQHFRLPSAIHHVIIKVIQQSTRKCISHPCCKSNSRTMHQIAATKCYVEYGHAALYVEYGNRPLALPWLINCL